MNKKELYELLRLDPKKVGDPVEFWAVYAKSFYEKLFALIDDPNIIEETYNEILYNYDLNKKAQDALTFFYKLRMDELENPDFWEKSRERKLGENMKAKLVKESLNESMSRYCHFYKASNEKWYMELAHNEYGEWDEATTYGPFNSEEATDQYLSDNFSNPGGMSIDDSGEKDPPTESPNGSPVQRGGGGNRMMGGNFHRRW